MKTFGIMLGNLVLAGAILAGPLATETTPSDGTPFGDKIVSLYKKEAERKGSPLNLALAKIQQDNDLPEFGELADMAASDTWLISSGRNGALGFSKTFLLGIPVLWKGTGLITEYIGYIRVNIDINLEEETVTINLEDFVAGDRIHR